jgi:hypothetical protein
MVVELVVLNQVARIVPEVRPINVYPTGVVHDVLNQVAPKVPKARPINVYHMAVVRDALIA